MPKTNKHSFSILSWLQRKFGRQEIASLLLAMMVTALIVYTYDPEYDYAALGYTGIFLASLIGNATLIVPAPVMLIVFAAGAGTGNTLLIGLLAGIGATIGESTGYLAGYGGHKILEHSERKQRIAHEMERRGFFYIMGLAFIPNPLFDAAGIVAGTLRYSWKKFFVAALIGKTAKMLAVAFAGKLSITWVQHLL